MRQEVHYPELDGVGDHDEVHDTLSNEKPADNQGRNSRWWAADLSGYKGAPESSTRLGDGYHNQRERRDLIHHRADRFGVSWIYAFRWWDDEVPEPLYQHDKDKRSDNTGNDGEDAAAHGVRGMV